MKKLYVLIDKQYDPSYRAVQAGHAVAEYLIQNTDNAFSWGNETLIYLLSDNLEFDCEILEDMGLDIIPFYEPDQNGAMTAFACYSDHKVFNRYDMN